MPTSPHHVIAARAILPWPPTEDWEHRLTAARKKIVQTIPFAAYGPPHAPELRLIHDTCRKRDRQTATKPESTGQQWVVDLCDG
jgi:hypothetical protein